MKLMDGHWDSYYRINFLPITKVIGHGLSVLIYFRRYGKFVYPFLFLVCVPFKGRSGVLCSLSTATQCQTTTLPLLGANFSDCYFMLIELKLIHCVILHKIKTSFVRECVQNVWKSQFQVIFSTCRA